MKKIKIISVFITLMLLAGMNAFGQSKTAKKGFAVLELFTSEGCSSCPPADDLMGKIQREYKDTEVYILSYHVDYWDKQGWKDIFSNPDYTKRQYEYAKWLNSSVYTPQLVINGNTEHIASQEAIVRNAMKKALSRPAVADLSLKLIQSNNKLTINHTASGISKNNRLLLAIVQKAAQSKVKRGENADRVLSHFQIVRHLHSIVLTGDGKGTAAMNLPKGLNAKDFEVIGFIQDMNTGAILGAAKAVL